MVLLRMALSTSTYCDGTCSYLMGTRREFDRKGEENMIGLTSSTRNAHHREAHEIRSGQEPRRAPATKITRKKASTPYLTREKQRAIIGMKRSDAQPRFPSQRRSAPRSSSSAFPGHVELHRVTASWPFIERAQLRLEQIPLATPLRP